MAIPEEIRRVARPKNTVVVLSGSKGANLYAVRERAGFKYGPRGNPQPINGRIIGHIVDGRYVPLHEGLSLVCKIQPFPSGIPKFPWVRPK